MVNVFIMKMKHRSIQDFLHYPSSINAESTESHLKKFMVVMFREFRNQRIRLMHLKQIVGLFFLSYYSLRKITADYYILANSNWAKVLCKALSIRLPLLPLMGWAVECPDHL